MAVKVQTAKILMVEGITGRGRGRKTWNECGEEDMRKLGLKRVDAQNRAVWRNTILGKNLTQASVGKRT